MRFCDLCDKKYANQEHECGLCGMKFMSRVKTIIPCHGCREEYLCSSCIAWFVERGSNHWYCIVCYSKLKCKL